MMLVCNAIGRQMGVKGRESAVKQAAQVAPAQSRVQSIFCNAERGRTVAQMSDQQTLRAVPQHA